jgi:hypothetical protein
MLGPIVLCLAAPSAAATPAGRVPADTLSPPVLLNEVLYDPEGADGGLEFVELAARGGVDPATSLEGWVLETGNGARPGEWTVAWIGRTGDRLIGGLFLIGESGVEPAPDAACDLDLQNGPDGCRLRGPGGRIDRLGWGDPLDVSLLETAPAEDVASGLALARLPDGVDTDHNAADFRARPPTPGEFNAPAFAVAVDSLRLDPEGPDPGAAARIEWVVRNVGRTPWTGEVRLLCRVHPDEVLARATADEDAVPPGVVARLGARASPPPGVHLPVSDPAPLGAALPAWPGGAPDLLVNEVLSRPAPGGSEWVEIVSTGASPVDLAALRLEDAAGTVASLRGTLPPGGFVVAASDTTAVRTRWALPGGVALVPGAPWPSLNHTGPGSEAAERIRLTAGEAEAAAAAVPGGAAEGISWERISRRQDGESLATWAASLDRSGATPGRPNSRDGDREIPPARPGALAIRPSPFRPAVDGAVLIALRPGRPIPSCRIAIYDTFGTVIAELEPWAVSRDEHRALWDGRHASGEPAALGLYLICARAPGTPTARAPLVVVR